MSEIWVNFKDTNGTQHIEPLTRIEKNQRGRIWINGHTVNQNVFEDVEHKLRQILENDMSRHLIESHLS